MHSLRECLGHLTLKQTSFCYIVHSKCVNVFVQSATILAGISSRRCSLRLSQVVNNFGHLTYCSSDLLQGCHKIVTNLKTQSCNYLVIAPYRLYFSIVGTIL